MFNLKKQKKKYRLTNEILIYNGVILHRIQALKDFGAVQKGELGGFVESEKNLSHEGTCWLYNNSIARGNSRVIEDAKIYDVVVISDNACISGNAKIIDRCIVIGNAVVTDHVTVHKCVKISGDANISGIATISDFVEIGGSTTITGNTVISDKVSLYGDISISDTTRIQDDVTITGFVVISGRSYIKSNAILDDCEYLSNVSIGTNAKIERDIDIFVVGPIGSRDDYTTFYKTIDGTISVCCGCFNGTLEDFKNAVEDEYGEAAKGCCVGCSSYGLECDHTPKCVKQSEYYNTQYKKAIELAEYSMSNRIEEDVD